MDIFKYDFYSGPNIGVYTNVNDDFVFLPMGFAKSKAENLSKYLKTDCLFTSIADTRLLGVMMVVNNQGILLPKNSYEHEFEYVKKSTGLNVQVLDTKYTALGNMICVNDKGGVASPLISREDIKLIQDSLDIEIIQKKVAGYQQVGAMIVTTSKGGIIHPEVDEDDLKIISNVLHVKLEPATINGGIPYVASGTLANNHSVVIGSFTTGPEIMMLTRAFTD